MQPVVWECNCCGYIYDEACGCLEKQVSPGTPWEDISKNWSCMHCGSSTATFKPVPLNQYIEDRFGEI